MVSIQNRTFLEQTPNISIQNLTGCLVSGSDCAPLTTAVSAEQQADAPPASPTPQRTVYVCQRNSSCACPDCADIRDLKFLASTPAKSPTDESAAVAVEEDGCLRSSDCRCDSCGNIRDVKLLVATPVKAPAVVDSAAVVAAAFCLRSSDCRCDFTVFTLFSHCFSPFLIDVFYCLSGAKTARTRWPRPRSKVLVAHSMRR